jgi:hypothetical protein
MTKRLRICDTKYVRAALAEGIGVYYGRGGYNQPPPNAGGIWGFIDRLYRKELESYLSYLRESNLSLRFPTIYAT